MTLKSDNQGFLVGELVESNRDLIAGQKTGNRVLSSIRTDVSAIARAMGLASRASRSGGVRETVEPMSRGSRSSTRSAGNTNTPSGRTSVREFGVRNPNATVSPVGRDSRGRFVAGQAMAKSGSDRDGKGRFTGNGDKSGSDGEGGSGSRLLGKIGVLTDALKGITGNSEQIDPTLAAMKEVKDVVEPLGRGAMALFGRSDKQKKERWYNRIWKSLTNIEKKPANAGPGGMPSMDSGDSTIAGGVAGMVARFMPAIVPAALLALGATIATVVGAVVGTAIGTSIYNWLDKSGLMTKIFNVVDKAKEKVQEIRSDLSKGLSETSPWLGGAAAGRGSGMDSRRTDLVNGELAPSTSVAQSVGRLAGRLNFRPVSPENDPVQLSKMDAGSRKKADFSGIAGGAMLGQQGTYTQSEAQKIRDLKSTGQNTGAFGKGGMTPEIQDKISTAAKSAGLDPVMMQKFAAMESGGNANAVSATGAIGLFQFTGKTATGVGIKDRFNADQNIAGGMKLAQENSAVLNKAKLPVTAENLYMMHQLGPKAAMEIINGAQSGKSKEELSPATQKAMNLNYGAKESTAGGYLAMNSRALDTRLATVTSGVSAYTMPPSISGTPAKLPAMPEISIPAPSTEKDRPTVVSIRQPIGQDVSDRSIAHVVTGGLGAS